MEEYESDDQFTLVVKQPLNVNWEVESFDVMGHLWHNGFGSAMEHYGALYTIMEHYRTLCSTMEYYATLRLVTMLWMGDHHYELRYKIKSHRPRTMKLLDIIRLKRCC